MTADAAAPATNEPFDQSGASARLERWTRAADRAGAAAALGDPERRFAMLRVFGAARYLSDLCLNYSTDAVRVLEGGPAPVIADIARDLVGLERGVGGADALHAALKPLKERADLAIGLAHVLDDWSCEEAASARADVAERLIETAIQWLARAAARRGDADAENPMRGVFVLAGGDLAHEELSPFGALDLLVVYDAERLRAAVGPTAERAFVRLGAELRTAFEGGPSSRAIFPVRGPIANAAGGLVASADQVAKEFAAPQSASLRRWFATARVLAGDRAAGGEFLEAHEETLWGGPPPSVEDLRGAARAIEKNDPRAAFRAVADVCRLALGRARVVFRAAPARVVFETAAEVDALAQPVAQRLAAGAEFVDDAVARLQLATGASDAAPQNDFDAEAAARLAGFADPEALKTAIAGAAADAGNTLHAVLQDPETEARRYMKTDAADDRDATNLQTIGFGDGDALSAVVDRWMKKVSPEEPGARLSAKAPGLLTAFSETAHPDRAIRLFDRMIASVGAATVFDAVGSDGPKRDAAVAAFGFTPDAADAIVDRAEIADILWTDTDEESRPAADWIARLAPTWSSDEAPSVEALSAWRREAMSHVCLAAVAGDLDFSEAPAVFRSIAERTMEAVRARALADAEGAEAEAGRGVAIAVQAGVGGVRFLPRQPMKALFVCEDGVDANAASGFARNVLDLCAEVGGRWLAFEPDVGARPGGVTAPLASTISSFRDHMLNRSLAAEKVAVVGLEAIAGGKTAREELSSAILAVAGAPRAADLVFREADRARAQRLRREPAKSIWDVRLIEGGLIDLEFVVSAFAFKHGASHPYALENGLDGALDGLTRAGLVSATTSAELKAASSALAGLAAFQAVFGWRNPQADRFPERLAVLAARAAGVASAGHIEPLLRGHAERVNAIYNRIVSGRPELARVS